MNQITINNRTFEVWTNDKGGRTLAYVYEILDGKKDTMPILGTNFGQMASFKNDIMPWAQKSLEKFFRDLKNHTL